jgi:hypothetical protein
MNAWVCKLFQRRFSVNRDIQDIQDKKIKAWGLEIYPEYPDHPCSLGLSVFGF